MIKLKEQLPRALKMILIMTIICGVIYPLVVTGISQLVFKDKANGSIVEVNGVKYGSSLLGQSFTSEKYLWGRAMIIDISTFADKEGTPLMYAYPSNISTTSKEFETLVNNRVEFIKNANPDAQTQEIPVDLVTCSGSGFDPQISVAAAQYQIPRIAKERGITEKEVEKIINQYTTDRFVGIFGEKVVNVLEVNLALDEILK